MSKISQFLTRIVYPGFLILCACSGGDSSEFNSRLNSPADQRYLYVVSGSCYGGGVATTAGPANTVARYDVDSGQLVDVLVDYNQLAPGDSPVSIADFDADHFLILVENASGRRIDLVEKKTGAISTYIVNSTALSAVMRSLVRLSDGSILVSKTSAIEKFNAAKTRLLVGAAAWINAPAGSCAVGTTLMTSVVADPVSGKLVYTNSAVTTSNHINVISSTGYAAVADCKSSTAAPVTTAWPTRALFHSSGKLLVTFGSVTQSSNFIYSYDFSSSAGTLGNATAVFNDGGILVNGPSSMTEDPVTHDVFVANVTSTYNTVERFHYDATSNAMTRATTQPFLPNTVYTRCVADMKVMN
jgi:hypothetical protein